MSRLELQQVAMRYGDLEVLAPVTARVEAGMALGLYGPTGCGKSTLLRIIAGLLEPSGGVVRIDGDLANDPAPVMDARDRGVGMVFQDLALWPHMSARRHLEYVLGATVRGRGARRERAEQLLARVRLSDHAGKRPSAMSRGQRQRLAIARALCNAPRLLLLDEPMSSQDPAMTETLCEVVREPLAAGASGVVASHERNVLGRLCSAVLVFDAGGVRCVTPDALP